MSNLKFAFRQLLRNPGFTAVAVLTLALGIGATTAIGTVMYEVLLRPLPYPDSGQLVQVLKESPSSRIDNASTTSLFRQPEPFILGEAVRWRHERPRQDHHIGSQAL